MPRVRVLPQYCKGCELCIEACPKHILCLSETLDRRGLHVATVLKDIPCTGCMNCVAMCPDAALEVDE